VNDAEERFAERLADDLARVLGVGIVVDDVELVVGEAGRGARVRATLLAGPRVEAIEAAGSSVHALYQPIVRRAAELRLKDAYWQMIGPA
jgi:predicted ATP-dependent serine protease